MRIAIATDWFPPRRGGIESQLLQLSRRLSERGHDVHVLTSTPGADADAGFRVHRLPGALPVVDAALSPSLVPALWQRLDAGYDVIHAHVSVISPLGYAAAWRASALGLPSVVTFHSVLRLKRHVLRVAERMTGFAAGGTRWTAVSHLVAAQLRDAIGAEVDVLPNGIDSTFWRRTRRPDTGPLTFVSVMRLHAKKRPRALVRAFVAAARASQRPVRLRIIGDGPERSALERDVRQNLPPGVGVEILGWLPAAAVRSEHEGAHVFVLASRREAFGLAALEAAAMGLPVITMSDSGSREFVRDGIDGLLCQDDEALKLAIGRFITDAALRARLSSQKRDLRRYDWSAVLDAHERIYHRAIARSPAVAAV